MMPDTNGGTMRPFLPGVNANTIWIVLVGLLSFAGNWAVNNERVRTLGTDIVEIKNGIEAFKTIYVTREAFMALQSTAERERDLISSVVDRIGSRLDSAFERLNNFDRVSAERGQILIGIVADLTELREAVRVLGTRSTTLRIPAPPTLPGAKP